MKASFKMQAKGRALYREFPEVVELINSVCENFSMVTKNCNPVFLYKTIEIYQECGRVYTLEYLKIMSKIQPEEFVRVTGLWKPPCYPQVFKLHKLFYNKLRLANKVGPFSAVRREMNREIYKFTPAHIG